MMMLTRHCRVVVIVESAAVWIGAPMWCKRPMVVRVVKRFVRHCYDRRSVEMDKASTGGRVVTLAHTVGTSVASDAFLRTKASSVGWLVSADIEAHDL